MNRSKQEIYRRIRIYIDGLDVLHFPNCNLGTASLRECEGKTHLDNTFFFFKQMHGRYEDEVIIYQIFRQKFGYLE